MASAGTCLACVAAGPRTGRSGCRHHEDLRAGETVTRRASNPDVPRTRAGVYNPEMPQAILEELKQYIGFDDSDARKLSELAAVVKPAFPRIVKRFYELIMANPDTRQVLGDDDKLAERLRGSMSDWLADLFSGDYGAEYYQKRSRIGHVHVRVRLPQRYMFSAMEVISQELKSAIREAVVKDPEDRIDSLQKLLALEMGIMLDSYRSSYSAQIRWNERSSYEEKLTRAQHLAHIGELAASLAHEIKNPLAGISGAIQVFDHGLPAGHPHKEILAEMLSQIDRLDRTVKDLLVYARPKPPQREPLRIGELFERTLVLLWEAPAMRSIDIRTEGFDSDVTVEADEVQLQQLFTNLVLNAAHACAEKGDIRCSMETSDAAVTIEIADSGIGMPSEVVRRAFEPFFTTKAKGTGLGLSICKRIVETHDGQVEFDSQEGIGTRVRVKLPLKSP